MKDNKIECKKTETPDTKDLNDKDILNDVLLSLKLVGNNYSVMVSEMSNKVLYKKVLNLFLDTKDMAHRAYNLAFSLGWYSLETVDEKKIQDCINKMTKLKKEL